MGQPISNDSSTWGSKAWFFASCRATLQGHPSFRASGRISWGSGGCIAVQFLPLPSAGTFSPHKWISLKHLLLNSPHANRCPRVYFKSIYWIVLLSWEICSDDTSPYALNLASNSRECWQLIALLSQRHSLLTSRSIIEKTPDSSFSPCGIICFLD